MKTWLISVDTKRDCRVDHANGSDITHASGTARVAVRFETVLGGTGRESKVKTEEIMRDFMQPMRNMRFTKFFVYVLPRSFNHASLLVIPISQDSYSRSPDYGWISLE